MNNLLVAFLFLLASTLPAAADAPRETVFDRVMQAGAIRCGYAIWDSAVYKDEKTGEMKGLVYDLVNVIGKRLNLKIAWAEEASWGTIVEGMHTGRYDMICTGLFATSGRAKVIDFSDPYFYLPVYLVARKDDARFDVSNETLNDPRYKIAVLDGELSSILAAQVFPKATVDSMSQLNDVPLLLKEVETKKADATVIEPETFLNYDAHNPGLLKIVDPAHPLSLMATTLGLPQNDLAFKRMIDVTVRELIFDGTVAALVKKYEKHDGTMLLPARPFQPTETQK